MRRCVILTSRCPTATKLTCYPTPIKWWVCFWQQASLSTSSASFGRYNIGTLGCSTSPKHCALELNFLVGAGGAFYTYKTSLILGEVGHGIYPDLTVNLVFLRKARIMNKVERVYVVAKSGKPLMPTKRLGMVSRVYNQEKQNFLILYQPEGLYKGSIMPPRVPPALVYNNICTKVSLSPKGTLYNLDHSCQV